jgi:hypothetical protein
LADSNVSIHIANSALYRLGEQPITSFDQLTPTSDLCRELYPDVRDTLLSWQAWPFATVRQALTRLGVTPPSDFQFYYALPTLPAVLRVIDIDLTVRRIDYQREVYVNPNDPNDQQSVIATDVSSVVMRYVGRTSEGVWSPLFVATMAVWLAASMAPSISGKASLRQTLLMELYGGKGVPGLLDQLRTIAGYEDSPREMPMPIEYEAVRGGGGSSAPTYYSW